MTKNRTMTDEEIEVSYDPLLKTSQVSEIVKMSRESILQLCKAGFLKHTVLGVKTIRIYKSSLDAFIKKGDNGYGK